MRSSQPQFEHDCQSGCHLPDAAFTGNLEAPATQDACLGALCLPLRIRLSAKRKHERVAMHRPARHWHQHPTLCRSGMPL